MAVRQITSEPKPSTRLSGYYYAYYNKPTPEGGECVAVFPPVLRDIIKKGFAFDDSCIQFDEALRASVLALDFDQPRSVEEPSVPPCPETGWADPDCLPPTTNGRGVEPQRAGARPSTIRRHAAAELDPETSKLPPALMRMGIEMGRLFLMEYALLSSVPESNRALIAQRLAVTAAIPYYRSVGIELTDKDVQGISMA